MKSFMVILLGLLLSVSVGAEPLLKGRVWLASGPAAAGVQVRLFDLTDLRRSVGTTTDEAGYFALPLQTFSTDRRTALPQGFALGPNYPNPFNPSTIIPYQIPTTTHVRLEVLNLLGQRLATLVDGERPAGAHTAHWDATDATGRAVGAGVYIYRLTGGGHTVSRRMVLVDGQAGLPAGGPGPMQPAAVGVKTDDSVYGLTVAGAGLIAYVDPAFRVGSDPVDLVLEQPGGPARMKVATGGILGDVNNDSQVDEFDVLYVALYSKDPSITLPNNGDISLGDVNGDGTVDLADGLILALYKVNPSDPTLPPGIGQPVDGGGDDHGDSPSSATALAVGSSRSGQLEPGGDVDYFRVEVSESGDLTVHTTGSLDTKGQLEDSAGAVLASDDDGGEGLNFRLAHAVSAGTYYIKVEGYNASTTGSYTIHASGPGGDGGPVNIPDANLRAAIAAELGKVPNAPITPDEMATLTVLEARDQGIRDLTGLEFATNLETLSLGENAETEINSNDISNLSPLSGLTNLTTLNLNRNNVSDISPLASLTNLTWLVLWDNSASDLSPLSRLTNLAGLDLNGNGVSDISALASLTNLTWLVLMVNSISDISPLVANTGLGSGDEVYLWRNPLSSTSLNTHIPALESRGVTVYYDEDGGGDDHGDSPSAATPLAVGSSQSGQIEPGGDVDYFRVQVSESGDLTVHTTGSLDTKGQLEDSAGGVLARDDDGGDGYNFRIAHAVSAGTYYLKVEGSNATTTGSYTIHASVRSGGDGGPVNIPDDNLRAVIAAALGKAPNAPITPDEMATLTVLEAAGEDIRNLAGLEFATNLIELSLEFNNITDVSPLSGLNNLRWLYLSANNITDVSPLASLNNLLDLWLGSNNITDVSPLASLNNLSILSLSANNITDVSPLASLNNLRILSLGANNIADVSPLSGLTNLIRLGLSGNGLADVSSLSGLTRLEYLDLSANNITDVSLSGLTRLEYLDLESNIITDVSPLAGLTNLTELDLRGNPLSVASINVHIAALVRRGVAVFFESFRQGDFDIELVYLDPFTEFQKRVVEYAARRWMSILPEDLQDIEFDRSVSGGCFDHSFTISRGERIDDLRIYVVFLPQEWSDAGIAGAAGPSLIRNASGKTAVGCMALSPVPRLSRFFRELTLHEMGHVFGVGILWDIQDLYGDAHFNGPLAIDAFNSAGGRNYPGPKVPVQREVGGHWRASVFQTELMIPYLHGRGWLSAITVQALADLGYSVDVTQADPYTLPDAAQTRAEIASIDSWDDRLSEGLGLGLSTHVESKLQCGVGTGEARELIYVVNEQGAIIRTLGD